jgi:catechol 2,3-dioxygenase-like lactoylglutathione lyase family enzyme
MRPRPTRAGLPGSNPGGGNGRSRSGLRGVHLRLPGHGDEGPTLEIYAYDREEPALQPAANRPGWGHIAFAVDDVAGAQEEVLAAGGSAIGEVVTVEPADGRRVTWCYVTDPEGNIVELQAWSEAS